VHQVANYTFYKLTRFSYRFLAASFVAAGLVGIVTAVDGCGTADCNDTATCPVGDDGFATAESAVEAGDETLATAEASPDTSDSGSDTIDLTADASDSPIVPGDVTIEASDVSVDVSAEAADVGVRDTSVEAPPADVGADVGLDTGLDVRDVGVEAPPPHKCVSNLLAPTNEVALSERNGNVASGAIDGNFGTRWESAQGIDPEWIYIDFGSPVFINRVRIIWETACGKNYDLQISNDATTWNTMRSITGNSLSNFGAPTDWSMAADHTGLSGVGRYLRIFGTARCTTNYGYSIWEMQVYGDPNPPCTP
jgi:hypothetical protein